jgi:hypothetical protein
MPHVRAAAIRVPDEGSKLGDVVTPGHRPDGRLVGRIVAIDYKWLRIRTPHPRYLSVIVDYIVHNGLKVENDSNRLIHISLSALLKYR